MTEVGDPRPITPEGWDNLRPGDKGYHPVTKPEHYNVHPSGIECIEITQHHNFCVGNAIKYLWRQGLKAGEPSVKDLRKAIQYIEFEIKRLEKSK